LLSIIIPTFNTKELTIQCIKGIYSYHANLDFEIIVVDDNSTDCTSEAILKSFKDVNIIKNNINKGYCYSNNTGMKIASGQYVVIMNSDVVFIEPVFDKMIEFLGKAPEAGFAAIKLLNQDFTVQYSCRSFPSMKFGLAFSLLPKIILKRLKSYRNYYTLDMDYSKTQMVDMASATCCIFRRELMDHVGLMDERYFMYVGDSEWFYRANKKGYKFYYLSSPQIIHLGSQSTQMGNNKFLLNEYSKGFELFFRDHMMQNYNIIYKVLIIIGLRVRHGIIMLKAQIKNSKVGSISVK